MPNIEEFPLSARRLTEYEVLIAAAPDVLDAMPGAVYLCDHQGLLVRYNAEAVSLWGREPRLHDHQDRFCGSHLLFHADGSPLPHGECPMAEAVEKGTPFRNAEVRIERPDGSRRW
jgi:PAS domain-containing protein